MVDGCISLAKFDPIVAKKSLYHELDLKIGKEVGDKAGEEGCYGNLDHLNV